MKTASNLSVTEFEAIFEAVKNWGRWGPNDERGTLNYITPEHVRRAAGLVKSGRTVSVEHQHSPGDGPDNPHPAIHYMSQNHDRATRTGKLQNPSNYRMTKCHGDCHTHIDA